MAVTSRIEANKELVANFERDVFNGRDYDLIDEYQAPKFAQHGPMMGEDLDAEGSLESLQMYHAAFSDLRSETLITVAEGDYVVNYNRYTGTHDGELMGVAPTDREATVFGHATYRIEDGKIAETWFTVDFTSMLAQLGLLPEGLLG